jgi:glutamate-ammonia-ligase adenylyltransferase
MIAWSFEGMMHNLEVNRRDAKGSTSPWDLAPDPEDARRWRDRLAAVGLDESSLDADAVEVLWLAAAHAPYLALLAVRDAGRLVAAAHDPYLRRPKPKARMAAELREALDGVADADDLARRLRAWRAREYIRLGARECGLGRADEVGRELSHLADVALDAAVAFHDAELERAHGEPRFTADDGTVRRAALVVFGMGKLGGQELNFSSDVDLIYAYSSDNGAAGPLSLHEYFDKLARRVTQTIGAVTEDDIVFRVDLRLRPEGSRGPLVNSLPSMERYYEAWGRPWERQAWLKARPAAGSLALGAETLALLEPFIYPRSLSSDVIADVNELNRKIKAELAPGTLATGLDVKLGVGGIREIEFFVQALQLVHAGKNRWLRARSTRRALDRLLFAGLVAEREQRTLAEAYELLRQIEHRLQLESGRQTHRLPADSRALGVLARRLGFADAGELAVRIERTTAGVAAIFATLGADRPPRREVAALLEPGGDPDAAGFHDPAAATHLDLLRRRLPTGGVAAARVAPALLEELSASPDPDLALRMAVDFVARAGPGVWRLLEDNPALLRLLASLFGTSAFLAKGFTQHPELLDALLLVGRAGPRRKRAEIERAIDLGGAHPEGEEAVWNAMRRVQREEVLRIGLADVAGDLTTDEIFAELSMLADVCVARTFALVAAAVARRGPVPPMAVIGLGKLGAGELGYASDLDLVFIYEGGAEDRGEHEAATKVAQRLVTALGAMLEEGRLYEVDTRLRPSGRKGTLVSSLEAWRTYHRSSAQLWERQALIKCRAVAGDRALGAAVEVQAEAFVYAEDPPAPAVAAAIRTMRARIEKEIARGPDLKAGRGGLLDVEFAAQYLQLAHGARIPGLRVRATRPALAAARAAGVIDEPTHAALDGGYRFLRTIENRLRIVHDRPIHAYPRDPVELDKLARRTGYRSAGALDRAYLAWTRDVRSAYERLLGP